MKLTAVVIVTMLAVTFFTPLLHKASATPITIASIDPDSGPVGTIVRVIGEIDTLGGSYQIWWDWETFLKEGNCPSDSKEVDDTFTVPSSSEGVHEVDLYDDTLGTYATGQFLVTLSSYTMSIEPSRIQEGLNTTVTVGVQGAVANKNYTLTVVVTAPSSASYTADLNLATDEDGYGTASKIYWGEFLSANTHFVGTYSVAVNESLATGNFTVGLTDKLVYETTEVVCTRGSGYNPDENVTVNIKFGEASVAGYPKNVTADMEGVVIDLWNVPIDAATGTYVVTLVSATNSGTIKEPVDVQEFSVTIVCQIQTRNLDDEPVADVTVEVYNATTSDFLISEKTNKTGWVIFFLETGNYTFKTLWKDVEVGSLSNQSVSGTLIRILEVQLAHIRIVVKDEACAALPLINVILTYNYTTRYRETLLGTFPLETNFAGIAEVYNTLTNISYTVEAWRYGYLFNRASIENLTSSLQVNITCPAYNLLIHVLDSEELPLRNVQVKVIEWGSWIPMETPKTTNNSGSTDFRLALGRYKVRVYNYSAELGFTIVLNETTIDLIEDRFFSIHCRIFNLDLSARVVDYFGQPIPNVVVEFEREGVKIREDSKIGSNGVVLLQNVIGGDYRISVYVGGRLAGIQTFRVDRSMEILFKIDRYVAIGWYTLEVSQLITLISMSLLSASFILMLTHRRLLLFVKRIREALSSKERKER